MFAPGVSLEDSFYLTRIIKHVAYLLGCPGSLEILLQVGPVLMENHKQLEVVAPNLAKLHFSWPGDRALDESLLPISVPSSSSSSARAHAAPQAAGQIL